MKNRCLKSVALFLFFSGMFSTAFAQTDQELLAKLAAENQEALEALVMYPAETRMDILEAAMYPEALIKMENIQAETAASFKKALESYPKETQADIWDITRYPGLVRQIIRESGGTKAGLEKIVAKHPLEIREKAVNAGLHYMPLLKQIDAINESAESAFKATIRTYPAKTQTALQHLLSLPEVLNLLTENIRLTILAGDLYRKEPAWTLHQADSLQQEVARRNAEELESWKKSLDENPQAREEMDAAAKAYGEENNVYDDLYAESNDDLYVDESYPDQPVRVVEPYYYPYSYWFGYPWWYDYPRWRPYPWWWDWGFYYGPSHTIIIVGLPSYHFMDWYFYHPWHHDHWSHLSGHFVRHYHHHRHSGSSICTGVTVWKRQHGTIIDDQWLRDDGRLEERMREYGRLEAGRTKYNRDNPSAPLSERAYLDRNARRFPEMSKIKPTRPEAEQPATPARPQAPARKPDVDKKPDVIPDRDRLPRPSEKPATRPSKPSQKPDVTRGSEQHATTSERAKTRENVQTTRTPEPRVAPPKTKAAPTKPSKTEKTRTKN